MAAQWIEQQAAELEIDACDLEGFARTSPDVWERLAFYAELQAKSLHRMEYLQYANAGVPMDDVE